MATSASPAKLQPINSHGSEYVATQLTPRAHYLHQRIGVREAPSSNVVIFEQSDGYVIVDAGLTHRRGEQIADHILTLGSEKPVKTIVITHWHGDHALGVAGLILRWRDAMVISTHRTRDEMRARYSDQYPLLPGSGKMRAYAAMIEESRARLAKRGTGPNQPPEVVAGRQRALADLDQLLRERPGQTVSLPTVTFSDRLTLHDSEYPLDLIFPGKANTEGDIIVWSPRDRIVAAGDIIVRPMPYAFGSHPTEWLEAIQLPRDLNFASLVPGHGEVLPHVGYLELLTTLIGESEQQIKSLLDRGVSVKAIPAKLNLEHQVQIFAGGNPYYRDLFARYFIEPMVENVVRDRADKVR